MQIHASIHASYYAHKNAFVHFGQCMILHPVFLSEAKDLLSKHPNHQIEEDASRRKMLHSVQQDRALEF